MAQTSKGTKAAAAGIAAAAAAAAAAAGYYFYASKDAKQHRQIAATWATRLKKDAIREAKKISKVNRATVLDAIGTAAAAYGTLKNVDQKQVARAIKELQANWKTLAEEAGAAGTGVKKTVQKAVAKAAKKPAKTAKKARPAKSAR